MSVVACMYVYVMSHSSCVLFNDSFLRNGDYNTSNNNVAMIIIIMMFDLLTTYSVKYLDISKPYSGDKNMNI
jgi:hypothetical protein